MTRMCDYHILHIFCYNCIFNIKSMHNLTRISRTIFLINLLHLMNNLTILPTIYITISIAVDVTTVR